MTTPYNVTDFPEEHESAINLGTIQDIPIIRRILSFYLFNGDAFFSDLSSGPLRCFGYLNSDLQREIFSVFLSVKVKSIISDFGDHFIVPNDVIYLEFSEFSYTEWMNIAKGWGGSTKSICSHGVVLLPKDSRLFMRNVQHLKISGYINDFKLFIEKVPEIPLSPLNLFFRVNPQKLRSIRFFGLDVDKKWSSSPSNGYLSFLETWMDYGLSHCINLNEIVISGLPNPFDPHFAVEGNFPKLRVLHLYDTNCCFAKEWTTFQCLEEFHFVGCCGIKFNEYLTCVMGSPSAEVFEGEWFGSFFSTERFPVLKRLKLDDIVSVFCFRNDPTALQHRSFWKRICEVRVEERMHFSKFSRNILSPVDIILKKILKLVRDNTNLEVLEIGPSSNRVPNYINFSSDTVWVRREDSPFNIVKTMDISKMKSIQLRNGIIDEDFFSKTLPVSSLKSLTLKDASLISNSWSDNLPDLSYLLIEGGGCMLDEPFCSECFHNSSCFMSLLTLSLVNIKNWRKISSENGFDLPSLQFFHIMFCVDVPNTIFAFGNFPRLENLVLRYNTGTRRGITGKNWDWSRIGKLEVLVVDQNGFLRDSFFRKAQLKKLQRIELVNVNRLSKSPWIGLTSSLRSVYISDCPTVEDSIFQFSDFPLLCDLRFLNVPLTGINWRPLPRLEYLHLQDCTKFCDDFFRRRNTGRLAVVVIIGDTYLNPECWNIDLGVINVFIFPDVC